MNAALNTGTREYEPQNRRAAGRAVGQVARRQRFETLLARVRSRQLDLAMTGHVEASARYAGRATKLAQQIVIVSQMSGDSDISKDAVHPGERSDVAQNEMELACCGV